MSNKKIGRNDPCWCGSGLKYKKCHLIRSKEEPIKAFEADKHFRSAYNKEYCCAPEELKKECSGDIVKAHSVSKSSALKAISEDGHVYGFKITLQNLAKSNGCLHPEKIGINQASTFTGFCSTHDNKLFEPVETGSFNESKEECFLYAYRALCKEYFTKKAAIDLESFGKNLDAGKSSEEQRAYQQQFKAMGLGLKAGMADLIKRKSIFDEMLLSKELDKFQSFVMKFNAVPTIAASGGKNIIYDFEGNRLQDLGDLNKLPRAIYYNYFSSNENGYVILSWTSDSDDVASQFVTSLNKMKPARVSDALIRFIFYSCENLYVSPVWWERLEIDKRKSLIDRSASMSDPSEDYDPKYLKDDNVNYDDWKYEETIKF